MSQINKNGGLPEYMSIQEWNALGVMGNMADAAENIFDGPRQEDDYAGNDEQTHAERERQAYIMVKRGNPLSNPNETPNLSDFEKTQALWWHYYKTLSMRGDDAVKLFSALARQGNRAIQEGRSLAQKGTDENNQDDIRYATEEVSRVWTDKKGNKRYSFRPKLDKNKEGDILEEHTSQNSGKFFTGSVGYTVVSETEEQAAFLRSMIEYALSIAPPDSERETQKMIATVSDLPPHQDLVNMLEDLRPLLLKESVRPDGKKVISVFSSPGIESSIAQFVNSKVPTDFQILPGRGKGLSDALIRSTKHRRVMIELSKKVGDKFEMKQLQQDIENAISASNAVVIAWNGQDNDKLTLYAIAHAYRTGKLKSVLDKNGKEYPNIAYVINHALAIHPTRAEFARNKNLHVFEVEAGSPKGRFALSLIKGYKSNAISQESIDILAKTGRTINELSALAKTTGGAKELQEIYSVPVGVIRQLADDRTMANARGIYERIMNDCGRMGVTIIGPESYPESLLKSNKIPNVLFATGNVDTFTNLEKSVLAIGDSPLPVMEARIEKTLSNLPSEATLIHVEGKGLGSFEPKNKSALFLTSGHDHYGIKSTLNWEDNTNPEIGISQTAKGVDGTYELYTKNERVFLKHTNLDGETKTIGNVGLPAQGIQFENAFGYTDEQSRDYKVFLNTLTDLKEDAQYKDTLVAARPVIEKRARIVENGGVILSTQPPREMRSQWSVEKQRIQGIASVSTTLSTQHTIALAAQISDITLITQASPKSDIAPAIVTNAEKGKMALVLTAPEEIAALPEVTGNHSLTHKSGKDLPGYLNLDSQGSITVQNVYGDKPAGVKITPENSGIILKKTLGLQEEVTKQTVQETRYTAVETNKTFSTEKRRTNRKSSQER